MLKDSVVTNPYTSELYHSGPNIEGSKQRKALGSSLGQSNQIPWAIPALDVISSGTIINPSLLLKVSRTLVIGPERAMVI